MIEVTEKYCKDVLEERIPSGVNLRNAVKRYIEDRKNGWVFREDKVEKVGKFIHKLKHFTGKHNKQNFKLEPWQAFIIANLYGFYNQDGTRRFQTAYLEMARKNGKTALASALGLNGLVNDDEPAAEVLFAANSKDQAKIAFNLVYGFTRGLDPDMIFLERLRSDIILLEKREGKPYNRRTNAFIKTLAADSDKTDGYNCSMGLIDEFHGAPNTQVRDVIRSSQAMRENPMLVTITTAGFDKSLPCYELRTVASEIAAGIKHDESFFGVIYTMDDGDDWKDPANWPKSNPNLGITVNREFIEKQVLQAVNSPNDEVGVKTKNLNVWCDSATTWIADQYIISSTKTLNFDDFRGELCYVGVDLASNQDLTAVAFLFVRDDKYYFFLKYYMPADVLSNKVHADMELYRQWAGNKYLDITAGNVTDYNYITRDLLKNNEKSPIYSILYDRWNATQWATTCTEMGLKVIPFAQSPGNFNYCTKSFERLMLGGYVILDDNPVTRYCLRNVEIRKDMHGNEKPSKSSEKKKIDGVIAMLQALAGHIEATTNYRGTNIF